MRPPRLISAVILILGLGIGLPIPGNLAFPQWLPAWRHVPFHAAIEFYGAFIALLLAWLLLRLRQYRPLSERLSKAKWAEGALHEREVRLHAIVDNASDGISIIDHAGRLVEINPTGLMFMECEKVSQVIGQPIYSYVVAEYLDAYRAFHERILGGEAGTLEFEILGRKGTRRWMESRSGPLRNPVNGQITRFAICRDITERRRSQAQIQYLAYHDTLTGLPNRALLLDRLERALAQAERYNQLMALLYHDFFT